jgi:acetolactate synthase I/III small subunit
VPAPFHETESHIIPRDRCTVLELTVNNHPGVMYHICGLFSRRAYNVEGIMCLPIGGGLQSRVWLLVNADQQLEQVIKQAAKLEDVLEVRRGGDKAVFERLEEIFMSHAPDYQQSA